MAAADEINLSEVGLALNRLRRKHEDADVTLVCGNRRFLVHRSVLVDASPYFRSMFASAWKESVTGNVNMPTVSEETMAVIIEFIYSEKIPQAICALDVCFHVAESAHFMEMPGLFVTCLSKLLKHANLNNIAKLYSLVELFDNWCVNAKMATGISSWGLNARIQTFLAKRFSRYIRRDEFLEMDIVQLKTVLQHPEVDVVSFEDLVRALLKWISLDVDGRKQEIGNIFCAINPSFVISHHVHCCLIDTVSMQGDTNDFQNVIEVVKTSSLSDSVLHSNTDYGKKLMFFGTDWERCPVMKIYDFKTNRWKTTNSPPHLVLESIRAVGYGGHIYFFGRDKHTNGIAQTKITRYCPHNNLVISTHILKRSIHLTGACGLHGAIYVLGETTERNHVGLTHTIQRYCPATASSEEIGGLNEMHSPLAIFASTNYLYVICLLKEDMHKELLCYDPLYDTWTMVTRIPNEWSSFAFTVSNEKLYLVDDDLMVIYDIPSGHWTDSTFQEEQLEKEKVRVFVKYGKEMLLAQNCKFMTQIFEAESPDWKKDLLKKEDFIPCRFQLHHCEMLKCVLF